MVPRQTKFFKTCWHFKQKATPFTIKACLGVRVRDSSPLDPLHYSCSQTRPYWHLMRHLCPSSLFFLRHMYVFNYVQLYRPLLKQILWRQINIETAKARTRNRHADTETQSRYRNLWTIQTLQMKKNSKKSQMLKIQLYWYSNFQILKELYFVENYA